jgi:uncharacterized membrane protein YiaA
MDTLTTFAKENYALISLFVGMIGVLIGIWSVCYEIKKKRKEKEKPKCDDES